MNSWITLAQPFEEVVKDVDVVFDTIGGDTLERAFQTLKKGGFLVTAVETPSAEKARELSVEADSGLLQTERAAISRNQPSD